MALGVLQLMQWTCVDDCRYECMWEMERRSQELGRPVEKYFGKWPFERMLGMQEPASVLLSFLNLVANAHCLYMLMGHRHKQGGADAEQQRSTMAWKILWAFHFILACNAWLWSCVFHSRDMKLTERLDYFSAGAVIAFDTFLSVCKLVPPSVVSYPGKYLLGLAIGVVYARHMYYMHYIKFDYGYHVGLCIGLGLMQSIAWMVWIFVSTEGRSHPGRKHLSLFVAAVNVAVLLEVLDFPPLLSVLDAHALWHLATVPLVYVWFAFVTRDLTNSQQSASKMQ